MANINVKYEIITMKKGTIKTVDGFIKNFNAIGANMKALAVSAYAFLTSEDKEFKKDFQIRVMDELGMTKATLSYLKTAGWLYTLDDRFSEFAYTNVIYFKKAIEYFSKKNGVDINENTEALLTTMFKEIATLHNSTLKSLFVESLTELSQKELANLINKYVSRETSEEVEEDTTEEATDNEAPEELEEDGEEIEVEEQAHFYSIIDEDFDIMYNTICEITSSMSKLEVMERVAKVKDMLESIAK